MMYGLRGTRERMTTPPADPTGDPNSDPTVATPPSDDTAYTEVTDVVPGVEPHADVAEEYAESVPVDPTPEQVEHYLDLVGDEGTP
jgi:hypothetical protein